ncbi:MAG: ferritin-like domain-containing protein [Acidobacteriota bacterium]|nr:ferritin-like domain-containing protein [Blastocatellia bacterium]MDW8412213.1 ferritin-like domain-containing protein [Acidobacteriota bacterium]
MSRANNFLDSLDVTTRRNFFKAAALAGIGSAAILKTSSVAASEGDVKIMNIALSLEHQAIAAYKAGAALLKDPVLKVAVGFMKQHESHRDALISTIKQFGGKPVEPAAKYDVAKLAAENGIKELKTEKDVLELALKLEDGAARAYFSVLPKLESKEVLKAAVSIMADEAMHTAVLRSALGQDPSPKAFFFGG